MACLKASRALCRESLKPFETGTSGKLGGGHGGLVVCGVVDVVVVVSGCCEELKGGLIEVSC